MKQKHKGTLVPVYDMTITKGKEVPEQLISEKEFNK